MWLFSRVCPEVLGQVGLVPRAKVTRGAHKWLLSRVRPEVPRQSTLVCCSIVALAARKRLFARVYAHVLVERRFLCRAVCGDVGKTGGECVGGEHVEFCMSTRSTMQWCLVRMRCGSRRNPHPTGSYGTRVDDHVIESEHNKSRPQVSTDSGSCCGAGQGRYLNTHGCASGGMPGGDPSKRNELLTITVVARERPLARVYTLVPYQMRPMRRAVPAVDAGEGLLAGVSAEVLGQVSLVCGVVVTVAARKRLLTSVDAKVSRQV